MAKPYVSWDVTAGEIEDGIRLVDYLNNPLPRGDRVVILTTKFYAAMYDAALRSIAKPSSPAARGKKKGGKK